MERRMAIDPTLTAMTATELVESIRAGDVSAQEVVESHIRRVESVNPGINAVVIRLFDEARREAIEADERRSRGEELGPLHGVPVTIKEQYKVAGTESTVGVTGQAGRRYNTDCPLVARLRRAGAIVIGKTNIMQTLAGLECDNPVYGRSNNPWDPERSPGGSSGGEAAIISAGGSPLGLGGDLGGSIRVPAHFCGICGLKPTAGRLTNEGTPAHLFAMGQEAIIAQPGPMARSVADLGLAMRLLVAPPNTSGDLLPPVPWSDPARIDVSTLKIGFYEDDGFFPASPAIRRAVQEAAGALKALGAAVEPFDPPDVAEAVRLFMAISTADGGTSLKHLLGRDRPNRMLKVVLDGATAPRHLRPLIARYMESQGQRHVAFLVRNGGRRSAEEYWKLVDEKNTYIARFVKALDQGEFDAVIGPPYALPAVRHGNTEHLFVASSYATVYNLLGMPAGVVAATRVRAGEESDRPVGKDLAEQTARSVEAGSAGLPVGVQVAARHWREDLVLAIMAALEEHFRSGADYPAQMKAAEERL